MDAVLVRVGGAGVEARVVDTAVGENTVDGVSCQARRVPGRGGKLNWQLHPLRILDSAKIVFISQNSSWTIH